MRSGLNGAKGLFMLESAPTGAGLTAAAPGPPRSDGRPREAPLALRSLPFCPSRIQG